MRLNTVFPAGIGLIVSAAAGLTAAAPERHAEAHTAIQFGRAPSDRAVPAQLLVDSAIVAMFGTVPVASLNMLRVDGVQHEYVFGNAERPEGPWRVRYTRFSELRDVPQSRARRTEWNALSSAVAPAPRVLVLADSVMVARAASGAETSLGFAFREEHIDRVDASPERALQLARAALAVIDKPVLRYGIWRDVVSFPYKNGRMRIELNRHTRLPEAVEITRYYPDDFRRSPFGDVTTRYDYVDWAPDASGFYWPRQHKVSLNGEPLRDVTVTAISRGGALAADSFAISDSARHAFANATAFTPRLITPDGNGSLADVADGIARIRDTWSMTAVRQEDGIVLFEAHISGPYLGQVIRRVEQRWAPLKVKGIVITSDPWAHIGGVREAIARGIPLYVSPLSIPFFKKLAMAPFNSAPDSLAKAPRKPRFISIESKFSLGTGPNRIELYPVQGPYAEHMTMAYFPGRKLLYGADLVSPAGPPGPAPAGANIPSSVMMATGYQRSSSIDLRRAVQREGLLVDTVFCVQASLAPFAWKDFVPAGMTP